MKFTPIIFLFFIICEIVYSQLQPVNPAFREKLIAQRTDIYERMIQVETRTTANQEKYDITYYSLHLRPNPESSVLSGEVEVVAVVNAENLDNIELNFWAGMNILDIHMSNDPGKQLYHTQTEDILLISLDDTYLQGEEFRVTIGYNGQPQNSPYQSFNFGEKNGEPMIWTLSQPYGARAWWPCKDVQSDKADSVDIRVTVPKNLIVASNGLLRETITNGEEITYWWHEQYAIVPYLVSLAIHPFAVYYDDYLYNDNSDTMKIHFYMFPENYAQYSEMNAQTKHMISYFAEMFGEYPFVKEKYGHADILGNGAMEHQTCSSFSFWNQWVIVHELAHQWWGNLVTCNDFHHIWLNEGFATYSEALWYEFINGPGTASYYQMTTNLYLGNGTVYVEDPQNDNIFDSGLSYRKGSWILHMLRHVVGEVNFFEILKTYHRSESHKYATATTEDFQVICEQVSGLNLDKFFQQWVYEEFYPHYSVDWNWIQNGQTFVIELTIQQEQKNHFFWMPIDVTITSNEDHYNFVVWDSLESQTFTIEVPSEPISLEIDKDNWILKTIQEKMISPTFDQGILLVNGVEFDVYDTSIRRAYENSAFWGDFPISFWDCFNPPEKGYPSNLPSPLGHGRIPADVLGKFSTVIWIGNNYHGDISAWYQTSILPYLKAGGNILLLTRQGQEFIDENIQNYLGLQWAESPNNTLGNFISDYTGLETMFFSDIQSSNAVFETVFDEEESVLLFKETTSFNKERALGVWKKPSVGGTFRSSGGQFVFISGRPYRFIIKELRNNSEFILENFFGESPVSRTESKLSNKIPEKFELYRNYPNPFNPRTIINYELQITNEIELSVYNLLGQEVATLVSGRQAAGLHQVEWDASGFSSGIYYYKLKSGKYQNVKKMILLK